MIALLLIFTSFFVKITHAPAWVIFFNFFSLGYKKTIDNILILIYNEDVRKMKAPERGKKMEKIKVEVTMANIYKYEAPAFGYGYETRYIYTMQDEAGTVYVWKTTVHLSERIEVKKGDGCEYDERDGKWYGYKPVNKGDRIIITASVKGQGEYKGQPQTELTRVKFVERTYDAAGERKEKKENKKVEQMDSIKDGDFIWEMPYKQFKEHYNDCETVIDSYDDHEGRLPATIKVIIREGRLKASGVRGQHFSGYEFFFIDTDGKKARVCYRAVSEGNAMKRLLREFPKAQEVTPGKIYMYGC